MPVLPGWMRARRGVDKDALELPSPTWREWLLAFAVMVLATAALLREQIVAFTSVPDLGDPLFSMWRLAWVAHQIVADPWRLFDANIFHPAVRTLAYSDAMLLPAFIAAPAVWLGAPITVVYTSLMLGTFVASGLAMFALARAVTRDVGASIVAALFFAFDPFKIAHYSHLELQFTCWMPLAALACCRTMNCGRLRDGILMGVFVALQALSSLYYGAYLGVSLAALGAGWVIFVAWPRRGAFVALSAGVGVAALVAAAVTTPYRANRTTVGERGLNEIEAFSARPTDYLRPHRRSAMYGHLRLQGDASERELFPGTVPLVLAASALLAPAAPLFGPTVAALAVTADASLGLNGRVYRALAHVPAFRGFRVPPRFRALVGLYLALLIAMGVSRMIRRISAVPVRHLAVTGLAVALLVDIRPSLGELEPVFERAPPIYPLIPEPRGVIAEMPLPGPGDAFWHDSVFMYFSTFHWHPLVNGMSGFAPPHYAGLGRIARGFPSDETLDAFERLGTQYFVLHEGYYRENWARVVAAADEQTRLQFVASIRWEKGEARAYRVLGPRR